MDKRNGKDRVTCWEQKRTETCKAPYVLFTFSIHFSFLSSIGLLSFLLPGTTIYRKQFSMRSGGLKKVIVLSFEKQRIEKHIPNLDRLFTSRSDLNLLLSKDNSRCTATSRKQSWLSSRATSLTRPLRAKCLVCLSTESSDFASIFIPSVSQMSSRQCFQLSFHLSRQKRRK